ncbi:MAG: 6-carboxytetrahydropterin synthase QueD [Zoogloeaceae bacterium]|jgi:6-pyruvoyltetrahydropterin/6-carboxytetrahydropterin synthase|nr:6-carboxytetrahydropterin synthase QueD [Zoogloeaceae bacterium]
MHITRRLEFDAGHRIPDHESQCRNLHGHRYVIEITLEGEVRNEAGASDNGMALDFSNIKAIARKHLIDAWDHAFLVWREDKVVADFLATLPNHKTVLLDCVPTAENLARAAFDLLAPVYRENYGARLKLSKIRLYETPNCWADVSEGGS